LPQLGWRIIGGRSEKREAKGRSKYGKRYTEKCNASNKTISAHYPFIPLSIMDSQYYISIREISRLAESNSIQCGEKGAAKSTEAAKTAASTLLANLSFSPGFCENPYKYSYSSLSETVGMKLALIELQ
jgi:chromosome condensin MukBEF complex kleisin-like MukF subunit